MPVEVTNALTSEMQLVADCREAVKKCESDVEIRKAALKEAKAAWETSVQALNEAIDAAIDAERQPTLFSRFGGDGDKLNDPPEAGHAASDPADAGDVVDAEYSVNPESVASLPAGSAESESGSGSDPEADNPGSIKPLGKRRTKKGAA